MLFPQNGERIVTIDSVTSLHLCIGLLCSECATVCELQQTVAVREGRFDLEP